MHIAAFKDSLEVFVYLESHGFPLDIQSAAGYLPLHYACINSSVEVVAYILQRFPSQAKILHPELNFIFLATLSGSTDILRLLFACGADLKENKRNRLIEGAIKTNNVECLKILLEKGESPSIDNPMFTSIMLAIINNNDHSAIKLLLEYGEDPSVILPNGECALKLACFQSRYDDVVTICDKLENVDIPEDMHEQAAVHWICSSKSSLIAKVVLDKGIDVNRFDKNGRQGPFYMLDVVPEDETIKILDLLLDQGYKIDLCSQNKKSTTMLGEYVCSINRPMKVIEWFLSHGADIHAKAYNRTIIEQVKYSMNNELNALFKRYHPEEYEN